MRGLKAYYSREIDRFDEFSDFVEKPNNQRYRLDRINSLARPDRRYNLFFGQLGLLDLGNEWVPTSIQPLRTIYIRRFQVNGVDILYNQTRHGVALSLKSGRYDFTVEYVINNYYVSDGMERFPRSPYYSETKTLQLNDVVIDDFRDYHLLLQIKLVAKYRWENYLSKYFFDRWEKDIKLMMADKASIDRLCRYYDTCIYAHHYDLNRYYGEIRLANNAIIKEEDKGYEKYIGSFINGERNGEGYLVSENGENYYGLFKDNQKEGFGVTYYTDGSYIYGYQNVYVSGESLKFYKNGDMEVYYADKDKAQLLAVYFSKSNDGFLRYYKDGRFIGKDSPLSANGNVISRDSVSAIKEKNYVKSLSYKDGKYTGEVYENEPHGVGMMTYSSGAVYLGCFNRGVREGVGTYHFPNGDYLFCHFKNGLRHGQGRAFFKDGRIEDVYYYEDKPIRKYGFDEKNLYPLKSSNTTSTKVENQSKNSVVSSSTSTPKSTSSTPSKTTTSTVKTSTPAPAPKTNIVTKTFISGYYEGEVNSSNKMHGKGTYKFYSGDKYVGEWKNDKKDGKGIYYYKNGDRYEGQFANDTRHGEGVYYFANGSKKIGTWKDGKYVEQVSATPSTTTISKPVVKKEPLLKHNYTFANHKKLPGDEVLTFADCKYIGKVKNGKPHLAGTFYYNDGRIYSGIVFDGVKENYGTWIYSNGEYYQGEIIDGLREGFGIQYYQDGRVYAGLWYKDKMNYVGVEIFPKNKEACVKIFNEGKLVDILHRQYGFTFKHDLTPIIPTEFYAFSDGDTYFGNFKDGKMHYFGKYILAGGGNFVTQIDHSDFDGFGTYFYNDGRRYIGQLKGSAFEGFGIKIENKKITIGMFKDDELIETILVKIK